MGGTTEDVVCANLRPCYSSFRIFTSIL